TGYNTARTTGTWPNLGVRYHFVDDYDARIEGPTAPVITVAPGTTLAFGHHASLSVGWDAEGGLVADGAADATRITFTQAGSDPSPGAWEGIYLGARHNRTRTRLAFVNISFAGDSDGTGV